RHQPGRDDQRRRRRRDGVRLARHRPAALRGRHLPRLPGRPGRGRDRRQHDHPGQLPGRYPLRPDRSPHSFGKLTAMTVITPPETATLAAATASRSTAFWRLKGFPLIPVTILLFIAFVAVFADVLAPYDPQIGSLARRFKPPVWQ